MAVEKLYTTYRAFLNFRHGKIRNICFGDEKQFKTNYVDISIRLVRYTN